MILKENKSISEIAGSLILNHNIYEDQNYSLIQLKFNIEEFSISSKFDEELSKLEKSVNRINIIKNCINDISKEFLDNYVVYDVKIVNNQDQIPLESYITILEKSKKDLLFYEIFTPSYQNQISVFDHNTYFDIQLVGIISNIKELNIAISTAFKTVLSSSSYSLWSTFSIIEYSNGFTSIKALKI